MPKIFMCCTVQQELWALLASASSMASGIPQQILDEKAEELRKKKELQEKNVREFGFLEFKLTEHHSCILVFLYKLVHIQLLCSI